MQNIKKIIFICVFFLFIATPYLSWGFFSKFDTTENTENRELSELPEFYLDTIGEFPARFENYVNDHLPYRNTMIQVNNYWVKWKLFGVSSDSRVIIGKDGWLYYNNIEDGDPMNSYLGKTLFSEQDLKRIADNLTQSKKKLEEEGKEFVIFIAPNKVRIYPEYLPEHYGEPAENYATKQLVEYLRMNTDIKVVYPYEELINAKNEYPDKLLYYKTDTHWNEYGAYVGTLALLKTLGIEMPEISSDKLDISITTAGRGDLLKMLNWGGYSAYGDRTSVKGYSQGELTSVEFNESKISNILYNTIDSDKKLFFVNDSFGDGMRKIISSQFAVTYQVHRNEFINDYLKESDANVFVYELVERYIGVLLNYKYE